VIILALLKRFLSKRSKRRVETSLGLRGAKKSELNPRCLLGTGFLQTGEKLKLLTEGKVTG